MTKGYVWNRVYDWLERVGGECVRRRVKGIVDNVIKVLFGVGQKS